MGTQEKEARGESQDLADRKVIRALRYLFASMEAASSGEGHVESFRVRGPQYDGGDYLVVLSATEVDGTPVVAFHGAATLQDGLTGAGNRVRNGSLKWHLDKWRASGHNAS